MTIIASRKKFTATEDTPEPTEKRQAGADHVGKVVYVYFPNSTIRGLMEAHYGTFFVLRDAEAMLANGKVEPLPGITEFPVNSFDFLHAEGRS
ncbi:hypothetical protein AB0C21_25880 [Spirillospora sp. NPDC049024]